MQGIKGKMKRYENMELQYINYIIFFCFIFYIKKKKKNTWLPQNYLKPSMKNPMFSPIQLGFVRMMNRTHPSVLSLLENFIMYYKLNFILDICFVRIYLGLLSIYFCGV